MGDHPAVQKDGDQRTGGKRSACGLQAVAVPVESVTRPVLGKRGFASAALLTDWSAIVGKGIAVNSLPLRIAFTGQERSGGVLYVKVESSAFAPHIQHLEPLILSRINGYFGWNAVSRLRLVHGPFPRSKPASAVPEGPPLPDEEALPDVSLALERLGAVLKSR